MTIAYPSTPPVAAAPSGAPRPRLTFLGTGYLGATYAICFAELGYEVLGFDVDEAKIAKLAGGDVPIHEPGLDELLRKNLAAGRLRFTTVIRGGRRVRRRPLHLRGHPAAARRHGRRPVLRGERGHQPRAASSSRKALIVGKSTVPVGTAEWIEQLVRRKHAPPSLGVEVAWSPEFLQEGVAVEDVLRPNRIIFGVKSEWATGMLYAAHKGVFDLAAHRGPRGAGGASPTSPPPSWSRSPPTPSSPPRSRSSTRWPRCARPPAPT